ncbi:MAG: hypothetical protein R3F62_30115 [Planctomycetota bacterium]
MPRVSSLACALLALAGSLSAQSVSPQRISRVLTEGLRQQNLVKILRDLPALGDRFTVSGATARAAFEQSNVREPFVAALFGDVERIEIDGDRVTFRLRSEQHLAMKKPGEKDPDGWLHLARTVKLRVSSDGTQIDKLEGVKASRSKNGVSLGVYKLEISSSRITVTAGKFGIAAFTRSYPIKLSGMAGSLAPLSGRGSALSGGAQLPGSPSYASPAGRPRAGVNPARATRHGCAPVRGAPQDRPPFGGRAGFTPARARRGARPRDSRSGGCRSLVRGNAAGPRGRGLPRLTGRRRCARGRGRGARRRGGGARRGAPASAGARGRGRA